MRLDDLRGRRVALLGMGIDVCAALPAIAAAGPHDIVVVDDDPTAGDHAGLVVVPLATAARDAEVLVRSPGYPRYVEPLRDALGRGALMTTPVDLWVGSRTEPQRIVMVTGTKGKSTTTDLIGHLAPRAGLQVGIAGNLGIPVFSDEWLHDAPVVVIEVSSYQASDLHHVPEIAVLTSLAEDHLDWHGSFDRYRSDKLRVIANDGHAAGRVFVPRAESAAVDAIRAVVPELVDVPEHDTWLPHHRVQNAALAAAVVGALATTTVGDDQILAAAERNLPGRLAPRTGPRETLWIDDALATNPWAAAAGLAWARSLDRPTIVLLGGADRGVDPAPLKEEIARWPAGRIRAVTLPENGAALASASGVEVITAAATVPDAVARAAAALPRGGMVMFSPSAPTPSDAGTWKRRSEAFRAAVAALPS
ncbi:MAG: Mur ligase family protein [Acidimicrobiia bacterium]